MVFEDISEQQFHVKSKHSIPPLVDRVLAVAFDAVLFAPIFSLLLSQILKRVQISLFSNPNSLEYLILFSVAIISIAVLTIIGQTLSLYYFGATPGKYFFKIKVYSIRGPEGKLTITQSFLRSALWVLEFFLLGVPFLEIMSHPMRRALHDRGSETVVVSLKQIESSKPHPFEVQFVRSFVVMFSLIAFVWGGTLVTKVYKAASRGDFKKSDLQAEGYFCDKISDQDKATSSAGSAARIDLAISMYLVERVEDHCLLDEAEFGLWTADPQQRAWGYLAKGIYFNSFDNKKAQKYLSQVCEEQSSGEVCKISQAYLKDQRELFSGSSATATVLRAQGLITASRATEAAKALDELGQKSDGFDPYIRKQMVKLMWDKNQFEKAEGAFAAIWSTLSQQDKVSMASWMCLAQVNRECSNQTYSSCDSLKNLIFRTKETGVEAESVVGLIKEHDCKLSQEPLLPQFARILAEEDELNQLIMAISKESDWSLEHRVSALNELTEKSKKGSLVKKQAQLALNDMNQKFHGLSEGVRLPASQKKTKKWEH